MYLVESSNSVKYLLSSSKFIKLLNYSFILLFPPPTHPHAHLALAPLEALCSWSLVLLFHECFDHHYLFLPQADALCMAASCAAGATEFGANGLSTGKLVEYAQTTAQEAGA